MRSLNFCPTIYSKYVCTRYVRPFNLHSISITRETPIYKLTITRQSTRRHQPYSGRQIAGWSRVARASRNAHKGYLSVSAHNGSRNVVDTSNTSCGCILLSSRRELHSNRSAAEVREHVCLTIAPWAWRCARFEPLLIQLFIFVCSH